MKTRCSSICAIDTICRDLYTCALVSSYSFLNSLKYSIFLLIRKRIYHQFKLFQFELVLFLPYLPTFHSIHFLFVFSLQSPRFQLFSFVFTIKQTSFRFLLKQKLSYSGRTHLNNLRTWLASYRCLSNWFISDCFTIPLVGPTCVFFPGVRWVRSLSESLLSLERFASVSLSQAAFQLESFPLHLFWLARARRFSPTVHLGVLVSFFSLPSLDLIGSLLSRFS